MKTKFVYIFVVLSLGMSSLLFAEAKMQSRQIPASHGYYMVSDPTDGFANDFQAFCNSHKVAAEKKYEAKKGCNGAGETGRQLSYEPDSNCVCSTIQTNGRPEGSPNITCTFGIHWDCEASSK